MTPALRLLVACCRWPDDVLRREAIRAAASTIGDWNEVVALADRHRVEPIVAHGLESVGIAVPAALAEAAATHRAETLRDVGESLRIAAALGGSGIAHRFLKGAALAVAAYGTPTLKRSWDIDLLVRPADAVAAAAVLATLGYAPVVPPRPLDSIEFRRWSHVSKEAELRSPRGATVELHWRVSDHPILLGGIDAASPSRHVPLLGSASVATLNDAQNIAYLAVHGTAHAWFRLKWIADFAALLASTPAETRATLIASARGEGVGHALDASLLLAGRLFGEPGTKSTATATRIADLSLAALATDNEDEAHRIAGQVRWCMESGAQYRYREARLRLRGSLDRADHPLPPHLDFLYPLLRVPFWARRQLLKRQMNKRARHLQN